MNKSSRNLNVNHRQVIVSRRQDSLRLQGSDCWRQRWILRRPKLLPAPLVLVKYVLALTLECYLTTGALNLCGESRAAAATRAG